MLADESHCRLDKRRGKHRKVLRSHLEMDKERTEGFSILSHLFTRKHLEIENIKSKPSSPF